MSIHNKKSKRRIMRKFKIGEISSVDRPAQAPAVSVIMKRDESKVEKFFLDNAIMTLPDDTGHSHLLGVDDRAGETTWSRDAGGEGHDHPWVINPDGTIRIGEMLGHTHEVENLEVVVMLTTLAATKTLEETLSQTEMIALKQHPSVAKGEFIVNGTSMKDGTFPILNATDLSTALGILSKMEGETEIAQHIASRADALELNKVLLDDDDNLCSAIVKNAAFGGELLLEKFMSKDNPAAQPDAVELQKKLDDSEAKVTQLGVDLKKSQRVGKLRDAHRVHYNKLKGDAADEFLAKTETERDQVILDIAKGDPVIYEAGDGTKYRKSDDERMVAMAKKLDKQAEDFKKSEEARQELEYSKRAAELEHLPGKAETHVVMLKQIDAIQDETVRTAALEVLKAKNSAMSGNFTTVGTSEVSKVVSGNASDELEGLAKSYAEKNDVSYLDAYEKVSDQNPDLLAQAVGVVGSA